MPNPKDTPNPYGHPVYKDWAKKSPYDRVYDLMHAHGTASEGPVCDLFSCHTFSLCYYGCLSQDLERRGSRETELNVPFIYDHISDAQMKFAQITWQRRTKTPRNVADSTNHTQYRPDSSISPECVQIIQHLPRTFTTDTLFPALQRPPLPQNRRHKPRNPHLSNSPQPDNRLRPLHLHNPTLLHQRLEQHARRRTSANLRQLHHFSPGRDFKTWILDVGGC